MTEQQQQIIHQLVGSFSESQLQNLLENLEYYLHPDFSMFVPIYRFCEYAVSPNHAHPAYSFIYTIEQKGRLLVNGKETQNPYGACLCAFSPDVAHQEIVEEGFSNYIAVFVSKVFFENCLQNRGIEELPLKGQFFPPNDNILFLLKMLMLEHQQGSSPQVIDHLHRLLVHLIIDHITRPRMEVYTVVSQNKIDAAISFMHRKLADKLTVNELAEVAHTSPSHFTKLFKEYTRKTPVEYLNYLRIEKAKRLLKHTGMNLTEIAFDCGFTSSSYFSHTFIEAVRLTPGEYRKRFQTGE